MRKTDAMPPARLAYRNNWENDEYYVGKRLLSDLKKVSINGVEYPVTKSPVSVGYSDMGHNYTSTSYHYFVKAKIFGKNRAVDLNTIVPEQSVIALDYTFADTEK